MRCQKYYRCRGQSLECNSELWKCCRPSLSSPILVMGLKWHTVFLIGLNVEKLKEAQDSTASHSSLLIIRNTIHNIIKDIIYWKWKLYWQNETRTTFYHLLCSNARFMQVNLLLLSDTTEQISFIQRLVRK